MSIKHRSIILMRPKRNRIGIDLGGTKIEGIILNSNSKEIFRKRLKTHQEKGYEQLLFTIAQFYTEMADFIDNKPHTFGIGTPGAINKISSVIKNANITCMNGKNFIADLEKLIKRKFGRQNDSNCFAIAEANFGAGRGKKRVFGAILGTGIGGGYIYNGKLITGLQSIAGEWGHSIIHSIGPTCYCGKIGCVETFISGKGIENRYLELWKEAIPMEEVVRRYHFGEDKASVVMADFFINFGKAFSNLITILDPDIIILGGGLSNIEELYTIGVNKVKDYIFNDSLITPIVRNKLGDTAGVIGAAMIGI